MSERKAYAPVPDAYLDRLRATTDRLLFTKHARLTLPAQTIHRLVKEVVDLREEIFRLQLCETVDTILSQELEGVDDEEDLLAIKWPDPYLLSEMISSVKKSRPTDETVMLPRQGDPTGPSPGDEGRRLPRAE